MRPLVFDGVGTITIQDKLGNLKLLDDKINKVTMTLQFDWEKVMGGNSGYAFHYTAQDLQDKVSIEVPRYSNILAEIMQGAETISGEVDFDETEEGILLTGGYTVKAPTKYGGTFKMGSEKVYLKDVDKGDLKPLNKVASTPTADQYSVAANGVITSNAANDNKNIVVMYKWTKTQGTQSGFGGMRRPKPFKFTHRFDLSHPVTGAPVPCQLTIFKALGGGTMDVSQERKKPSTNQLSLEIMEPDITPDNPNGLAATLTFGI